MKLKSYKKFSQIMVDIKSKRDYIIANPDIAEKDILKLIRLYDYILDEMEYNYDLIIEENEVNRSKVDISIKNMINRMAHIWEDKYGKDL